MAAVGKVPRMAEAKVLREATGSAPTPWWWPAPEEGEESEAGTRPPSAAASSHHEAFAAAALNPTQNMADRPEYVHWLYAQALGYQGFAVPCAEFGQLALTTPHPDRESHVSAIEAQVRAATNPPAGYLAQQQRG